MYDVGDEIRWRNWSGPQAGTVLSAFQPDEDGPVMGYYVDRNMSTQGFPSSPSAPLLVGMSDIIRDEPTQAFTMPDLGGQ